MYLWLSLPGIAVGAFVLWFLWKAHTHPSRVLARQAVNMNWVRASAVKKDGYPVEWAKRSVRFVRDKDEAIIWYKAGNITLVRPHLPIDFDDFIELERWLALEGKRAEPGDAEEVNNEILYYREIEKFVTQHGYFEQLLEVQGTDEEFCVASMKIYKAGYLAGEPAKVIGALTLEALVRHNKSREVSLEFLAVLEEQFHSKPA